MRVDVTEAVSRRDLRRFIRFPYVLYRDQPHYVPRLLRERNGLLDPRNPIFEFIRARYLLALDERGYVVGRASAHLNEQHDRHWGERAGFFGFYESVDEPEVARALMDEVERWLTGQGAEVVRGPFSFSTNEDGGFLARGFEHPPVFMMPYTMPYYLDLFDGLGYRPARELVAYDFHYDGDAPAYFERFARRAAQRTRAVIRPMDMRHFARDVARAFSVYNRAWAENWGFVPMTEAQFHHMAKEMKLLVDPAIALVAEVDDEPVGFFLALPDYNLVLKHLNGRLFPFGLIRLLLAKRSLHAMRVLTLGVVKEYRRSGLETLLIYRVLRDGHAKGYTRAELSWVLEENVLMRRALERMGAVPYKSNRIYEKPL